ncbi:MAG TPA: hypothetical protein VNG53_03795 [Bacteroidia bacterium]|nr:hypothetical protein [Bacteroidia bacterium]
MKAIAQMLHVVQHADKFEKRVEKIIYEQTLFISKKKAIFGLFNHKYKKERLWKQQQINLTIMEKNMVNMYFTMMMGNWA